MITVSIDVEETIMNEKQLSLSEEELTSLLNGLDDDIQVPLEVSSAWRSAVREEEKRMKRRGAIRMISSVAAAIVVILGATILMRGSGLMSARNSVEGMMPSEPARLYYTADNDAADTYLTVGYDSSVDTEESAVLGIMEDRALETIETTASTKASGTEAPAKTVMRTEANAVINTENVDSACDKVEQLVGEANGYVEWRSRILGGSDDISYRVNVPVAVAEDFGRKLLDAYPDASYTVTVRDESKLYADATERLNSLNLLADRTNELILTASEEELTGLYEKLSAIYDEMDELRAGIPDSENEYAEVNIIIHKLSKLSVSQKVGNAFENLKDGFMTDLGATVIILLPAAAIIVLLTAIFMRLKRKNGR